MSHSPLPDRIDIWHNILWSTYKGEVFSSIHALADPAQLTVRFIQIAETDGARARLSGVDLSHHRYPLILLFKGSLHTVFLLRRWLRVSFYTWRSTADLVLLAGYEKSDYWLQWLILKIKRKKIAVFCDSTRHDRPPNRVRGWLKSFFFRRADAIFCYGARSQDYVLSYGAEPARVFKRCQAAALPAGYSATRALATRLAQTRAAPNFLYVGRLSPEKDLVTLLQAFAQIHKQRSDATLTVVGDGPQRTQLIRFCQALGLADQVDFAGSRSGEALFASYTRAFCLMLPSRSEPWGLVVNEALAYGCPAVVSDHCGCVPELIVAGKTGFVHRAGDAEDLAARMRQALMAFADIEATARFCQNHIAHFSPADAARQIIDGLTTTLHGSADARPRT